MNHVFLKHFGGKLFGQSNNPHEAALSARFVVPAGLSSAEYQQPGKASCVSVNWTLGDAQLEVVSTGTGRRRDSGTPSRLCKHALFTRWSRLHRKVILPGYLKAALLVSG